MSDFTCKECGKEFDNRKSFHMHLKAHSLFIGDYYVKHFQKKDLYTGSLLPFKNYDQYRYMEYKIALQAVSIPLYGKRKTLKNFTLDPNKLLSTTTLGVVGFLKDLRIIKMNYTS